METIGSNSIVCMSMYGANILMITHEHTFMRYRYISYIDRYFPGSSINMNMCTYFGS